MLALLLAVTTNLFYVGASYTPDATHFNTVTNALNAVAENSDDCYEIRLANGTYREKVELRGARNNITLIGNVDHPEKVVISWNDANGVRHYPDGREIERVDAATSNLFDKVSLVTFSVGGTAKNFEAQGVTFYNSAWQEYWDGLAIEPGQALALKTENDTGSTYRRCRFVSGQDTVCIYAPLYMEDCYIEGTVDFLYGTRMALFNRCRIYAKGGWVCADGHGDTNPVNIGYLFYKCKLTVADGASTYLNRPWRKGSNICWVDCTMGPGVDSAMWSQWNGETRGAAYYRDYGTITENSFAPANKEGQWGEGIIIRGTTDDFWTLMSGWDYTKITDIFQDETGGGQNWVPTIKPGVVLF